MVATPRPVPTAGKFGTGAAAALVGELTADAEEEVDGAEAVAESILADASDLSAPADASLPTPGPVAMEAVDKGFDRRV